MLKKLYSFLVFVFVIVAVQAQAETYYLQAYSHITSTNPDYEIQVERTGNSIRIHGLYHALPETWIEGRIEDNLAIFESGQKLADGVYMQCSTDMKNTVPLKIEYNALNDTYEAYYQYLIFANAADAESAGEEDYRIYEQLQNITFFSGSKALTQLPAKMETMTYRLEATDSDTDKQVGYNVTIGFDGDDIYIQGFCSKIPEAWVKGHYDPLTGHATFLRNQYLGQTEVDVHNPLGITRKTFDIWFTGIDEEERYMAAAVFKYDTDNGAFQSLEHSWVVFNGEPTKLHYLQILRDVNMCPIEENADENYSLVTPPANLPTVALTVQGTDLTFADEGEPLQPYEVKCGIEGEYIYIQGLFPDIPEAWVRGRVGGADNRQQTTDGGGLTVTFPAAQYLGKWYGQMDTWIIGITAAGALQPIEFRMSSNGAGQIASLILSAGQRIAFTDSTTEVGQMPFAIYSDLLLSSPAGILTTKTITKTKTGKRLRGRSIIINKEYDLQGRSLLQRILNGANHP